jgi:hypothetical protein
VIPVPPRIVRRIVLAPVVLAGALLVVLLSPVLAVAALVMDVFAKRQRTLRVVGFGVAYCAYEVAGLLAVFGLWVTSGAGLRMQTPKVQDQHYRLMAWWLRGLRDVGSRLYHIEVAIEDRPVGKAGPILVFSRHGGAGNSLMLVATLMLDYDRHPRIIMLEKLQWEPLFDTLLHRLPNRFIRHGAEGRDAQLRAIGDLASGLGDRDAFVLFPEGHDFKPQLRLRAIAHLHKKGHHESAARAEQMANVLPPRHGGVTAAIANAPDADIVFVAHTLFEDVGSLGDLWHRIPLDAPVWARTWRIPPSEVPSDPQELISWLYAWWARIDAWISDHVVGAPTDSTAAQVEPVAPLPAVAEEPTSTEI